MKVILPLDESLCVSMHEDASSETSHPSTQLWTRQDPTEHSTLLTPGIAVQSLPAGVKYVVSNGAGIIQPPPKESDEIRMNLTLSCDRTYSSLTLSMCLRIPRTGDYPHTHHIQTSHRIAFPVLSTPVTRQDHACGGGHWVQVLGRVQVRVHTG